MQGRRQVIRRAIRGLLRLLLRTFGHGTAYMALKAGVPVLPVAITGTEGGNAYAAWKRLHRPRITVTFGEPFLLEQTPEERGARREHLERATEIIIMRRIAAFLPAAYRGHHG